MKTLAERRIGTAVVVILLLGTGTRNEAAAQDVRVLVPPVPVMLERLESQNLDTINLGGLAVRAFLGDEAAPEEVDELLAGLSRLSRHPNGFTRRAARIALSNWAKSGARGTRGVASVLTEVYDGGDDATKLSVLLTIVPHVGPESGVVEFLSHAAAADSTVWSKVPTIAIETLSQFGESGRSALRELHEGRGVTSIEARSLLESLASKGFRTDGGGSP